MKTPFAGTGMRIVLAVLALLLISLLIWFVGPYLAFADHKPLESVTGKLIGILIVVIIWAVIVQIRLFLATRSGAGLAAAVSGTPGDSSGGAHGAYGSSGDEVALRERFARATESLRQDRKIRNLYELPWYIMIGPPGSGKTTALLNAGLEYPLAKEFGPDPLRGVGGTRNCEWLISDQAILLDTAGRYTTQDSNENQDRGGWVAFLSLLRKYRKRRPVNGVLVAISLLDLMQATDAQREQHIVAIRRRLDELYQQLRIDFPVYFLFTKVDLVAGFEEFFGALNVSARRQVWGMTFPLDSSRSGTALGAFQTEFDLLTARVQEQVLERLSQERDIARRTAIVGFPAQVAAFKSLINGFLTDVMRGSNHAPHIWVRGCYFTSGTQEGRPVDRLLNSLARSFGLSAPQPAGKAAQGKAYFLENLLKDVVFKESGLAGVNRRSEVMGALVRSTVYAAVLFFTVLGVVVLTYSYRANVGYLDEVATAAQGLGTPGSIAAVSSLEAALPRLDALHLVVQAADKYREHTPLGMRWGLYQGTTMGEAAQGAYVRELNSTLGPFSAFQFAGRMRTLSAEPDKLYEYLKAYLMLGDPKRLDPAQMKLIGDVEWRSRFAGDADTTDKVIGFFSEWIGVPDQVQPVALDANLVNQVEVSLQQASLPLLMYGRMRLVSTSDTQHQVHLDRELSLGSSAVFVRKSGRPLSEPLSALYTRPAFDEFERAGKLQLMREFLSDGWVLGPYAPPLTQSTRIANEVTRLYELDYDKAWDGVLADITIRPIRDLNDANEVLAILSSPSSPLKRLLALVDDNTNFSKPTLDSAATAAVTAKIASAAPLDRLLGADAAAGAKPGASITAHFAAVHALVSGPSGGAPIDRTLQDLATIQQQIRAASSGGASTAATLTQATDALKALAAQLPPSVASVVSSVGASSVGLAMGRARDDLENRYLSQVVAPCRELVGNRYPFRRDAGSDVALADFGRLFGYNGIFDAFYQSQLASLVDNSRAIWRWKDESKGVAAVPLAPFQDAERIRQVFFKPGGQSPELTITLAPDYLDADSNRFSLTIDSQTLDYSHGPVHPLVVTWPSGVTGTVNYLFEDRNGGRPNQSFNGPWALFRFLDAVSLQAQSETVFGLKISAQSREARLTLTANSVRNPFARPDMLRFRCGGP